MVSKPLVIIMMAPCGIVKQQLIYINEHVKIGMKADLKNKHTYITDLFAFI